MDIYDNHPINRKNIIIKLLIREYKEGFKLEIFKNEM
jgi:hypothetical protein